MVVRKCYVQMINNVVVNQFSRKQGSIVVNFVDVLKQVYCTKEGARKQIANVLKAKSVLKKNSNAKLIGYVNTDVNVADIMTIVLPARAQSSALIERLTWDITHDDSGCVNPGREDPDIDEQEKRLLG